MTTIYNLEFKAPILKNKCYISHVKSPLILKLNEVKIKNIKKLNNSSGYYINLYISPKNNIDIINDLSYTDKEALDNIILNNDKWFNNGLEVDELKELYNFSYCPQSNTVNCILSSNISYNANINNEEIDEDKLLEILLNVRDLKNYIISIDILHAGLYFYPELSINKWIIKSIKLTDIEYEKCEWDREDIENDWCYEVNNIVEDIDSNILIIEKQITELTEYKNNINTLIKEIKELETTDKNWENKIDTLKNLLIKKYKE
jgi:hypothetical protein